MGSRSDPDLSPAGLRQAASLAPFLMSLGALHLPCFSSPAKRALRTAYLAGLSPRVVQDLREVDLGLWDGLPKEQVMSRWPEEFKMRGQDMEGFRPPGGESFLDVRERVLGAFHAILPVASGGCVILGHRGALWALVCALTGLPLGLYGVLEHHHCGVHVLSRVEGGLGFRIQAANLRPPMD